MAAQGATARNASPQAERNGTLVPHNAREQVSHKFRRSLITKEM